MTPFSSDEHFHLLRLKLVMFFERRGCYCPEDLADDCLHRLTLSAANQGPPENTDAFAFGVAKNVYKEWVRESSHFGAGDQETSAAPLGGSESRLVAKIIVDSMDPVDRHLLEEFYLNKNAETLAAEYGLSPGGLRTKIHRARKRLIEAYSTQKNSGAGETKPVAVDTDRARGHET